MSQIYLKILAMITMVIGYVGALFFDNDPLMVNIGRCSFVIYAFLIAEAYNHIREDRERVKFHIFKLVVLILVAEIPYDIITFGDWSNPTSQNVVLTLFIGFGILALADSFDADNKIMRAALYIAAAVTSFQLRTSYQFAGVFLILLFYIYLRDERKDSVLKRLLFLLEVALIYIPIFIWVQTGFGNMEAVYDEMMRSIPFIISQVVVIIPLALYNRKEGYRSKWFNNIYNVFYPVLLMLLCIIKLSQS